ncbi:FKBP-type peptidyl-prolyl cis-trans isomerase [Algoriphagus machipongonensis]|nr:FKBP-type peptidyl-prolyl cis-trans isomerase [Algoriphagus machipongonensis]
MRYLPIILLCLFFGLMSCEPNNPFNTGPAYDVDGNLAIDSVKIVSYLDTAQIDSLYRIHDPSGVVIIVQEEGEGSRPIGSTVVYTDYIGTLMEDGSLFDTSIRSVAQDSDIYDEDRDYSVLSFVLGAGQVITGWDIAFRRLRPGSKARLVIPSPYGYRDQERFKIPANSVLIFDVDFKGID